MKRSEAAAVPPRMNRCLRALVRLDNEYQVGIYLLQTTQMGCGPQVGLLIPLIIVTTCSTSEKALPERMYDREALLA